MGDSVSHRHVADAVTVIRVVADELHARYGSGWRLASLTEALRMDVEARPTGGPGEVLGFECRGRSRVWADPRVLLAPLGGALIGRHCVETLLDRAGLALPEGPAVWGLVARVAVPRAMADDVAAGRVLPADLARHLGCPPGLVRLRLGADEPEACRVFDGRIRLQLDCLERACGLVGKAKRTRDEDAGPHPESRRGERPYSRAWPFRPGDIKG